MTRVLFVTSNGTGLGHLTRCMAIARRLPAGSEAVLLTLSQALPVARAEGFRTEFLLSYDYGAMPRLDWEVLLDRRLVHLVQTYAPDVVVADVVTPYRGLRSARDRLPDVPFVWLRRGMWKPQLGADLLRYEAGFAAVLEPGEHAAAADRGPTASRRAQAHVVAPIVYLDADELLDREQAATALGLDPDRPASLVQLGSGALRSAESAASRVVAGLRSAAGMQVTVAESVLKPAMELSDGVSRARVYPLARYAAAFDLAVAAPGYNLFHEALAYRLPTLFVPKADSGRDDQAGRGRWAHQHGYARFWDPRRPEELRPALEPLLDADHRSALRQAMSALPRADGGRQAAEWLTATFARRS